MAYPTPKKTTGRTNLGFFPSASASHRRCCGHCFHLGQVWNLPDLEGAGGPGNPLPLTIMALGNGAPVICGAGDGPSQ